MENHNTWIAQRIDAAVPDGTSWTPREVADQLVSRLEDEEPAAFARWKDAHAADFIRHLIVQRSRADRARHFRQRRASAFSAAAESYADGDDDALDPFKIVYTIDEASGERLSLGDMTGRQCAAAAEPFRRRASENAMQARFLEALAKRAGMKKIKNAYDRETLLRQMASVGLIETEVAA